MKDVTNENEGTTHKVEIIVPKGALAKARAMLLTFGSGLFWGLSAHRTEFWRNNEDWIAPSAAILGLALLLFSLRYWIKGR